MIGIPHKYKIPLMRRDFIFVIGVIEVIDDRI